MWLDIIQELGADYYFVCDNKWLEHKVMKLCIFRDLDIKFIPSFHKNKIHKADYLYTGFWRNATYAHLTPFYHAKQNNIAKFWSIDADDTFLLMKAERTAKALKQVKDYADFDEMDIVSLDMWLSRTFGQHWSFGVTYVDTTKTDFVDIFENISSSDWMDSYKEIEEVFNLDWFVTYLRDKTSIKVGSFYIDNCWFVHFGDVIGNPIYGWVNYWKDGWIHYPILEYVYNNRQTGCLPICNEAERIDVGASEKEGMKLLENRISKSRYFKEQQRRLFKNETFANDRNYFRR